MAKDLSKQRGRERLEADGETHRRDCECPRCEAGFRPAESARRLAEERAQKRTAAKRGRLAAARAWERRQELERLRQLEMNVYFAQQNAAAEAEVKRLRGLRARALADQRLDELLRLRNAGVPLDEALAEVDRRFPTTPPASDNDNADNASSLREAAGGAAADAGRPPPPHPHSTPPPAPGRSGRLFH